MILDSPGFKEARSNNGCFFFGNIGLPTLTWEEVIGCLDIHLKKRANGDEKCIGNYRNGGMVLFHGHEVSKIQPLHQEVRRLSQTVKHRSMSSQVYVSMSSISGTHGRHVDPKMDVFIWHQLGRVDYKIHDKVVEMHPGDMLYITKGIWHEPVVHTPRVTISTAIEYD